MRIGLVSAEFPPAIGGVGDHTARLARELARAGHEADVLTSAAPSDPPPEGMQILRKVRRWDARIWWQVPQVARRRGWDVLHIQYQPAAYALHGAINLLPWVMRGSHPAVVTTFHDLRFPYLFPKAGPLRIAAVAALAKGSDAVISVADDDLSQLRRWRHERPLDTTQHVPLGDQLDAPVPRDFDAAAWRARFGLAADTPVIAYFGLMNASKGVLELVDALAELDGAHLLIVGEQIGSSDPTNRAYLDSVRARVADHGLTERVHWTGYGSPSELLSWLSLADVVALPFTDGASLRRTSWIAAMAHHGAVVTTQPRGAPSWYTAPPGNAAAVYVPARDPVALVASLKRVLDSPALRAELGLMASLFAERFAWSSVVRETVAVYEAALRQRRA